ncbi:hypothetical protein WCE14_08890 [Acinetobacter schindleri]|uniref:Uncharacterized protein n=2 Tax=Acinetobacter schindleri TaxID=108981 RepID=N8WRZ6_9GAMM|nr:hypothetical protein F965_00112 [Acinetobacter schindleri NIPH 900]
MSLHWVGSLTMALIILQALIISGGLVLMYKAIKILDKSYREVNKESILLPIFGMITYTLLCVLYRQALSSHVIVFHAEHTAFIVEMVLGGIQFTGAMYILARILKHVNLRKQTR